MIPTSEPTPLSTADCDRLLSHALDEIRNRNVQAGQDILNQILQFSGHHLPTITFVARFYLNRGEPAQASRLIQRGFQHHPDSTRLLVLSCEAEILSGNIREGKERLEQITRDQPLCIPALYLLAKVEASFGTQERALALFHRVLVCDPDFIDAGWGLARVQMPGPDYPAALRQIHDILKPQTYLEIGVCTGLSIRLANSTTRCVGIDPAPRLREPLPPNTKLFTMESDAFFEKHYLPDVLEQTPLDLAFIDGLHTFDQVLKDFINLERFASPSSLYILHDTFPVESGVASRQERNKFWAGDVWKVIPILKAYRPDLVLQTLPIFPTGITLISQMDPTSTILSGNYDTIVKEFMDLPYEYLQSDPKRILDLSDRTIEEALDWMNIGFGPMT